MSWGSSVSIVSDYNSTNGGREGEGKDFSSSLCVQTDSEDDRQSHSVAIRGLFPGGKGRPGREPSAEIKNDWELYFLSYLESALR
jgi:hypothetical protein